MIPIFTQEITDGISEQVKTQACIAIASEIHILDQTEDQKRAMLATFAQEANPNQFDLFYIDSVLVSTGWNKNFDVFDNFEAWRARSTPVDKQFNFMHNEKDIIGHITSSRVVGFDNQVISEDVAFDQVPKNFDIIVGSVLYKIWSDQELQNRMNSIIEGISKGRWFVSMECLFRNFDYAIQTPDNRQMVLARNEQTAFLTKYLKQYGGPGEYENHKIGRLLRDFSFSGKGLVDKPANERSLILGFNTDREVISFASATVHTEFNQVRENVIMAEETVTKAQYDELKAEFEKVKASINEQNAKKVAELESSVANFLTEINAGKEVMAAKDEKISKLEAELTETKKALEDTKAEVSQMKLDAVKASRLSSLLTKEISEEKAKDLVEKFVNASEEMFAALLESLPAKSDAKCGPDKKEEAKMEEDKEEKDEECDAKTNADTDNLDNVEASEDVDVNVNNQEVESLATKAAAWFSEQILKTTAKIKKE